MIATVLFSIVVLATTSSAREYNCTVNESMCTGSGVQTIVVSGMRMCCPPGATFSLNNNDCKCVEPTVTEEQCLEGVVQCRQASSFSRDSQGNLRCCMPGYALNSITNSVVNGVMMDVCTCTPMGSGGFMSTFLGNGGGAMLMSNFPSMAGQSGQNGNGQTGNVTDFREQWRKMGDNWRNWGRDFAQGFRTWGQNFGQSMRGTGLDLARNLSGVLQSTLRNTMGPLQRAVNDMIGHVFSSIPRF